MPTLSSTKIGFYEFLNRDLDTESFEKWLYSNRDLEHEFPEDVYIDLISFSFKTGNVREYISKLVRTYLSWEEYEKWRTVKLLNELLSGNIEIVLATRCLRQLYYEQEEQIGTPLISLALGVGFESVLDNCPIESEYHQWNAEALKRQLEPVEWYRDHILQVAKEELELLTGKVN